MSLQLSGLRKGSKVVFSHCGAGTPKQREIALCLEVDKVYTVTDYHISDFNTDIYLEGFDISFNSSFFEYAKFDNLYDELQDALGTLVSLYKTIDKHVSNNSPFTLLQTLGGELEYLKHQLIQRHKVNPKTLEKKLDD